MKLVSVQIQNYKCIEDSGEFKVKKLTCLAGKNESGKSALLQALRRLNPVEESERNFNRLKEYPHHKEFDPDESNVITANWELSDDDLAYIEEGIAPGVICNRKVIVKLGYSSNHREWDFDFDESKIIPFLVSKVSALGEDLKRDALKFSTLQELYDDLTSEDELDDDEHELLELLKNDFPNNDPCAKISRLLDKLLPSFLYFSNYGILQGKVSVGQLMGKLNDEASQNEGERIFLALLELLGTNVNELEEIENYDEKKVKMETFSKRLTDKIREHWKQNQHIEVDFSREAGEPNDPHPFNVGNVFHLRIKSHHQHRTVEFNERSSGFIWFFSFLVWFSQMERRYGNKLVILLDEPGLSLHGKAQNDLLGYIKDDLLPKYQVIYTTHSPFMIDPDNILNVRTVANKVTEDGAMLGTKVSDHPLKADAQTLFPLRAALDYGITQSLFIGEHCLLVEGKSDKLYLQWFSKRLEKQGRTGLDYRWVITPVGGIDKFHNFVVWFAGNDLGVAVVADFHSGDKGKVNNLRGLELLGDGRVFSANNFVEGHDEADIEDMIGRDLYVELINRCYALEDAKKLPLQKSNDAYIRVVEEVDEHFRTVVTEGDFFDDHLRPAIYLMEHESEFQDVNGLCTALDRFEQFFKKVNALLP